MAKTVLGIDMGYDNLKLALVSGGRVKRTVTVPTPVKLIKEGRVVSTETMGELIRKTIKENGLRCRDAAVALSNETVLVRTVTLPQMTADQLITNLPYEFRDYIPDELKNYYYDYAMIDANKQEQPEEGSDRTPELSMEMLAVAAPVSLMTEIRDVLRKAGLKLANAAPALCSYINLIRAAKDHIQAKEFCILDLGYRAIRMYMFRGDVHLATRILETGLDSLDEIIAEEFNVDVHLAHTYLLNNYHGCQESQACVNAYNNVAVELMRAVNFYRFSNPGSELNDIWLCGGGAAIPALRGAISGSLMMNIHPASELVPDGNAIENCNTMVQAIGIALGNEQEGK